ncbi:MAG: methyltransferase domain-containing protein [Chloroflexi bacterium]|nr:methyltransferase domain-containing protein [Chloroflexota bacterium]
MNLRTWYDAYWSEKGDLVDRHRLRQFLEHIADGEQVLVLDSGNGVLGHMLLERGYRVFATDLSGVACRMSRDKGLLAVQVDLDAGGLPFADESFDIVVSDSGLEHRFFVEPVLDEVVRVLRPRGQFLLLLPNIAHWWVRWQLLRGHFPVRRNTPTDFTHLRHFTLADTRRMLEERGLRVVATDGSASLWVWQMYPVYFRWPVIRDVYTRLARGWPSLFARDFIIDARKSP